MLGYLGGWEVCSGVFFQHRIYCSFLSLLSAQTGCYRITQVIYFQHAIFFLFSLFSFRARAGSYMYRITPCSEKGLQKRLHVGTEMPPTGRLKASVSAPRLITAPGSGADLTRVDAQARFHTPPVHIYAMGLDGPRAATSKRLEGNEHYLLPRKKPPNPRQVAMQRELCVGGGRSSRATWAEAKPSTAASEATTMVAPLRTHIPLPPEHRLPNSYLDAERRASAEPQTYGSTALCRNQGLYGRPARPRPGHPMALVKPARRHSDRTLVGVFDTGTGTAAVLMQVRK